MSAEPRKSKRKDAEKKAEGALKEAEEEVVKAAKSVKREVKKVEKSAKGAGSKGPASVKPKGKAPEPAVLTRHETWMIARRGKGFSLGELAGAGITPRAALRWGVSVDHRRRSVIEGNVSALKHWNSRPSVAKSAETKTVELAEEVEGEAAAIVKEAEKAEKALKKESKKAATAVKEKVEKPKARQKKKDSA
ncbi:MAG: ribosomal protein L13e [Nitrososphaerota archaeon]|nr:ribosomal protein L13e [Nitrososphaerota archaeon]